MKKYIFPYGFEMSLGNGKVVTFPSINLILTKKENSKDEFSFLVLVDSGAEVSLFTKSDAEMLGISLETGKRVSIGSASGNRFLAFLHSVIIKIGEEKFKAEIAFSERDDTPRLLGRRSIFSHFFIVFDDKDKNTVFIPRKQKLFEKIIY